MSGLLFVLTHLTAITLVAATSWALGGLLVGSLPFKDSLERSVFAIAVGLGALASAVHLLGLVGAIRPAAIWVLIAAPLGFAVARRQRRANPAPLDGLERGLLLPLLFGLAPAAVLALYPPTAFDATLYHLPYAKAFSTLHTTAFLPTLRFPVFPQLVEMLYAAALSVSDDITAQLIHFLCLVLTAGALVAWGRRLATARAGAWAAAAWLGSPIVLGIGAAAYLDIGLALFCTLCLYAWSVWRETAEHGWLDWSAAFAGLAASTKYHGLVFVFAIPVALWIAGPRSRFQSRTALRYLAIAILVLTPFYARIVIETGNPLFPYFSGWFGPSAWAESIDPMSSGSTLGWLDRLSPRHGARVFEEIFLPGEAPRRAILSPFLLVLPPLILGAVIADRRRRPLCAVLLAYGVFWYLLTPSARFLFPILPAGTLVAAAFADDVLRRHKIPRKTPERAFAAAIALALVLPGATFGWRRVWRQGPVPMTPEAHDRYLDAQVRSHAALRALNQALGDRYTVFCLHCESAAYYANGRFLGDHFGPYSFARVEAAMVDGRTLHTTLREMGVTHLLVNHTRNEVPPPGDPAFAELFTSMPAPPGVSLFALR